MSWPTPLHDVSWTHHRAEGRLVNRYADCTNHVELIFQTVGTASRCWDGDEDGVFDDQEAIKVASECIDRLRELHPSIFPPPDTSSASDTRPATERNA